MGAANSTNNSNTKPNQQMEETLSNLESNKNKSIDYSKLSSEEMKETFDKITLLSNQILDSFSDNFLGEEFCNKVALIYQKKMEKLNIKVLREIKEKLDNEDNTLNLKLMLQYIPKNDNDKYFVDFFHERLNEYFYKKGIKYQKRLLESENVSLSNMNNSIESELNYIDFNHVNQLLKQTNAQTGGQNGLPSNFASNLNKKLQEVNKKASNGNINGNGNGNENIFNENNNGTNIENINNNKNNESNILKQVEETITQSMNPQLDSNRNIQSERERPNNQRERPNNQRERPNNQRERLNNQRESQNNQRERPNNQRERPNNQRERPNNQRERPNNQRESQNNQRERPNNQRESQTLPKQTQPKQNQPKQNQPRQNQPNQKQSNQSKPNQKQRLKYFVPRSYKEPEDLCEDSNNRGKKCLMTKKSLCRAIGQNFVVRNNIIAAILTAIPRVVKKNGETEYIGGICFQKFLNLEKAVVCVPLNFKELTKSENLSNVILALLDKSRYIDEKSCAQNNGYFLRLDKDEKETLLSRSSATEENFKINPSWRANKQYMEFITKLKNKYFESLNFLITILEELKNNPFISNSTLNQVSIKTKNIIDDMYNWSNYYYIYATLSLMKSDYLVQANPGLNQLNKINRALEK